MDEFNKKFMDLMNAIHTDYESTAQSILLYYIEALSGEMQYQLRDKDPTTLLIAQEMVVKIDRNMQSSGKSNIPGYTRALIPPKQQEIRAKDYTQETYDKKMKEMNDRMEALQADYANQLKNMQNRVINMERAQTSQKNFPPKGNWVQKKAPREKRPPNQLDSTNMVEEVISYCRPYEALHKESTYYMVRQILEHGVP